jgi:Ca2+-binding EF-hand superfamily protein
LTEVECVIKGKFFRDKKAQEDAASEAASRDSQPCQKNRCAFTLGMGSTTSSMLCEEELEELKSTTVFDYREIEHLYERFQYLDRQSNGYLTYNELNSIPEFQYNPFGSLIGKSIERMTDYENMTFPHFLSFLEIFNKRSDRRQRIRYLFDVFDLNGDGRLCRNVLVRIGNIMGHGGVEREADELLERYDETGKGYIDLSDFSRFYCDDPKTDESMLLDLTKNIKQRRHLSFIQVLRPSTYEDED